MASVTVTGDVNLATGISAQIELYVNGATLSRTVYGDISINIDVDGVSESSQSVTVAGDVGISVGVAATTPTRQQVVVTGDVEINVGCAFTSIHVGVVPSCEVNIVIGVDGLPTFAYTVSDTTTPGAFVLNVENLARSEYSNYAFDSMIQFQDKQYGCDETGLYLLDGDDDNGTDIIQMLQTGLYDNGTSNKKNVPDLFVGCEGTGVIQIRLIKDNEERGQPILVENIEDYVDTIRVKLPLNTLSRYIGFEIRTLDNAKLNIDNLEYDLDVGTRR